jgi:hypothetical protein
VRKIYLIAVAMLLAACSRDIQNSEAVRQSVVEYLQARTTQTGLNVNLLQVDVTSISFERDQARATVAIRPKGGGGPMMMNYLLDRKGNKWVVRPGANTGANPHGASEGTTMPPGHPGGGLPPGGEGAPSGTLPPGHPSVGAAPGGPATPSGTLPPGHPPVGSKQ